MTAKSILTETAKFPPREVVAVAPLRRRRFQHFFVALPVAAVRLPGARWLFTWLRPVAPRDVIDAVGDVRVAERDAERRRTAHEVDRVEHGVLNMDGPHAPDEPVYSVQNTTQDYTLYYTLRRSSSFSRPW